MISNTLTQSDHHGQASYLIFSDNCPWERERGVRMGNDLGCKNK